MTIKVLLSIIVYLYLKNDATFSILFILCFAHFNSKNIVFQKNDDFNHRSSHKTLATRTGALFILEPIYNISLLYIGNIQIFDYSLFIPLESCL